MPKKKRKLIGRVRNRNRIYFWWSESRNEIASKIFLTKQKAETWRDNTYWRYAKNKVLDKYLSSLPESSWFNERKWWEAHKKNYLDLTLEEGHVVFLGKRFEVYEGDEVPPHVYP